ncbi:hypothetical protein [Streptomyces abyssalis]|uniref:hypothetical protein n=1 Tax=Streptomyces abyssalis TaxID=933944 RepID=UPI00085C21F1|nr:hypothetical protein [Streptomyces abyssalis]
MSGGYEFDPEAAKRVEKGLKDAIAEFEEVGYFSITSQQGQGFSSMSMTGLAMGDAQLASAFGDFCDRWGWAVKEKIHDANQMALGLGLNAGLYHEQEEYVVGSLKELTAAATANNPADASAAAEGAAGKSWEQIQRDSAQKAVEDKPVDYSLPDFDEMGDQWKQVGDDGGGDAQGGGDAGQQQGNGGRN